MGLRGKRSENKKAEGKNPSAFLCGLIAVEFLPLGELA